MTTLEAVSGIEKYIHQCVEVEHKTHTQVSQLLQEKYPGTVGLSNRSVRRFCRAKNIHATSRLSPSELSRAVSSAVSQVSAVSWLHICQYFILSVYAFYSNSILVTGWSNIRTQNHKRTTSIKRDQGSTTSNCISFTSCQSRLSSQKANTNCSTTQSNPLSCQLLWSKVTPVHVMVTVERLCHLPQCQ